MSVVEDETAWKESRELEKVLGAYKYLLIKTFDVVSSVDISS